MINEKMNCSKEGEGVLLIALGSPNYGNMAANLASSLKFGYPDAKIHLVYSGNSITYLTPEHKGLFNSIQECPSEYYTKNGKNVYIKSKLFMYELSPFEKTLFLDSDMLWFSDKTFKSVKTVFEDLKDVEMTFQNRDFFDLKNEIINEGYSFWCNIKDVKEKYFENGFEGDTGKYYSLHSEFVYFSRSESNQRFFKLAREIFDNPKLKGKEWGGDLPDELAFAIAMAITGKYPHKNGFLPIYWFAAEKRMSINEMVKQYYGLSLGGHALREDIIRTYHQMAKFYARAFKLPFHFTTAPKKLWAAERKHM